MKPYVLLKFIAIFSLIGCGDGDSPATQPDSEGVESKAPEEATSSPTGGNTPPSTEACVRDDIAPALKNLVIDFETWDGTTGSLAGGFLFNSNLTMKPLTDFGTMESGKKLSAIEFKVARDADVYAPVDGTIFRVEHQLDQWWAQDYEIQIQTSDSSRYIVSIDHVNEVTLKEGDPVVAGQIIGKAGNWITGSAEQPVQNQTFGAVELQINKYPGSSCTDFTNPTFVCPFEVFDVTEKDPYQGKVNQLIADWEAFRSDSSIYNEAGMAAPGCTVSSFTP